MTKVQQSCKCTNRVMVDLIFQRFQYAELMLYDNHNDNVNSDGKKATKELYSEIARNHVDMHVSIGMLNHNTEMLERILQTQSRH